MAGAWVHTAALARIIPAPRGVFHDRRSAWGVHHQANVAEGTMAAEKFVAHLRGDYRLHAGQPRWNRPVHEDHPGETCLLLEFITYPLTRAYAIQTKTARMMTSAGEPFTNTAIDFAHGW